MLIWEVSMGNQHFLDFKGAFKNKVTDELDDKFLRWELFNNGFR